MIKNKVLTPVLAGVLGVSVIGSGVGYYFVNKDGKNGVKPEETMDSIKFSLAKVEETIDNTVTDVEKAVKGELDYAYDSNLKISFGDGAFKNTTTTGSQMAAASVKPIEINTRVMQKGQNSEAEISFAYNNVSVATLETVYAKDSKTAYFRIPELSSSYIKATEEDLKKLFEDTAKKYTNKYQNRTQTVPGTTDGKRSETGKNITADIVRPDLKNITKDLGLPDLSAVDSKKLEEKLKSYAELVKSKIPAKKDNGTVSGDIDGNAYSYKVQTYSINGKQAQEIITAVLDKMASDEDLKKYYEDFAAKAKKTSSIKKSYAEFIAELKKKAVVNEKDLNKAAVFDIYYDGEDVSGFALSFDGKNLLKAVLVSKNDLNAVDISMHDENGKELLTVKGSAKLNDGKIDGTYNFKAYFEKNVSLTGSVKLDKVVIKDDFFSGTAKFDVQSNNASGKNQSFSISISGKSTKDNKDLTFSIDANNKNVMKIEFTQNKTDATDVEIPTGKIFTVDQLEQYKATCDFNTLKNNITKAIGVDIFGALGTLGKLPQTAQGNNRSTTSTTLDNMDLSDLMSA